MADFYLGIDFGTSGTRAIALDRRESIRASVARPQSRLSHSSLDRQWRNTLFEIVKAIPQAIRTDLRAIAIDGTSSTVLICDRRGRVLSEPLLYNDDRGRELSAEIEELLPNCEVVQSATSSLAKLLWWHHRGILPEEGYFLHQADWLAGLLHGQWGISDYHNTLKLGYDAANLRYPDALQQQAFFTLLPEVLPPGTPVGPIQPEIARALDIAPCCQICTGTTDSIAAFLASGASQAGEAVTSLGSTLVLKLLSQTRVEDRGAGVYSHRLGSLWLAGGASNTGGAVLRHFFGDRELGDLSADINPDIPSPLHYYPLLKPGDRFPINDPHLFPVLEPRPDDPVAFLHGLLESMARIEALGYRRLHELGATPLQRVLTAGGGAKNLTWQQIRIRHLKVPITPSPQVEAARGAALLAKKGLDKVKGLKAIPFSENSIS